MTSDNSPHSSCSCSHVQEPEANNDHICWGGTHDHAPHHILGVDHLDYTYATVPALRDISFSMTCGHSLALVGPNGAGKSTLLKILAGILKPSSGSLFWKGAPLQGFNRELAYLPQHSHINPHFPITVRALVEMGRYPALGNFGHFGTHDHDIVERALETMKLEDLAERQIGALSGGQQQRAYIARALAQEAHVILLDEPFAGLDTATSESLMDILSMLTKEGRLLIASHHDLNTLERIFDYTLFIHTSLIDFGKTSDVLERTLKSRFPGVFKHTRAESSSSSPDAL